MKIEIELLNKPLEYKSQMIAVDKYIELNTLSINTNDFLGVIVGEQPQIKETAKNQGQRIELENSRNNYHVSCRKTKGGIYKFKVWRAF